VFQPYTSEGLLDVFVDGHIQYWGDQGLPSLFTRFPTVRQFYKDMLRYGQTEAHDDDPKLAFTTLEANQEVMSYHFGFLQGKNFLCHITHYDETHKFYTPGLVHMDRSIFYTLAKQGTRFEFGRGDEPYKKLWTETSYPLWSMVAYRNIAAKALWKGDLGIKRLLKKPIGDLEP
jgi:CelD/BcsL family acetyltransferase involved in cellulose biosynthesis